MSDEGTKLAAPAGSAFGWIDSLGIRMWEWCEYDGFCQLRVTKKPTPRALRGGQRIAGILRELGVTEEQAKNWHWRPEEDVPNSEYRTGA